MNRLFIELYLDEDVDVLIADLVRSRGFRSVTTVQAGRLSARDAEQLHYASSQGWCMLTHNRVDFEALAREYELAGRPHSGIIIAVHRPRYELARRILSILDRVAADEMDNTVRYI